jgi:hypothetical protein
VNHQLWQQMAATGEMRVGDRVMLTPSQALHITSPAYQPTSPISPRLRAGAQNEMIQKFVAARQVVRVEVMEIIAASLTEPGR